MARRYSRRRRACRMQPQVHDPFFYMTNKNSPARQGLTILYPSDHASRPLSRPPNCDFHIHLSPWLLDWRSFHRDNGRGDGIEKRNIPAPHVIQVHRRILQQAFALLDEVKRLYETIQNCQFDVDEMDWDYSPTTATLCNVAHAAQEALVQQPRGEYLRPSRAWSGSASMGKGAGSEAMVMAMEIDG
ncbi:hypothetical protein FQN54_008361 [Arachnomyces sp. PD_36]|nr:hypothetical protein FQN54_008361 [Arachnomyces sp. PD_36]